MAITVRHLKYWIELCELNDDVELYIESENLALMAEIPDKPGYYFLEVGDPGALDEEEEEMIRNRRNK